MNTFEQNLEMLIKLLGDRSKGIDEKTESLIEEMQITFQEGADCPLSQNHRDFLKILQVNSKRVPERFWAWAKGVAAYEIAMQRSGFENNYSKHPSVLQENSQPKMEETFHEDLYSDEDPSSEILEVDENKDPWMSDL